MAILELSESVDNLVITANYPPRVGEPFGWRELVDGLVRVRSPNGAHVEAEVWAERVRLGQVPDGAALMLASDRHWSLRVCGPSRRSKFDLSGLQLSNLAFDGPLEGSELVLPALAGSLTVQFATLSGVRLRAHPGSALSLVVSGSSAEFAVNGVTFKSQGPTRWESHDYRESSRRLELLVTGEARELDLGVTWHSAQQLGREAAGWA